MTLVLFVCTREEKRKKALLSPFITGRHAGVNVPVALAGHTEAVRLIGEVYRNRFARAAEPEGPIKC